MVRSFSKPGNSSKTVSNFAAEVYGLRVNCEGKGNSHDDKALIEKFCKMTKPEPTSVQIHQDLEDLEVLRDAIDAVPHPFSVYDRHDRLIACSQAYRQLHAAGFRSVSEHGSLYHKDIIKASFRDRFSGSGVERKIEAELSRHRTANGYTKDVNTYGYWARRIKRVTERDTVVGFSMNIDELVNKTKALAQAKRQMEHQAAHDPLTGLPNRRGLQTFLNQNLDETGRALRDIAVLHLDLDKFKSINDTLGHDAGDAVLLAAATILRDEVRKVDLVARIGGDEFVIVCLNSDSPEDMGALAKRLIKRLAAPIRYQDETCQIGGSVGIAFCPKRWSIARILINADLALYQAKANGRGCYELYTSEMRDQFLRTEAMGTELRAAIAAGQFEPHFQPQVNAATGQVCGFEALARWNHPDRGMVSPGEFIPAAEAAGLMGEIDNVMMTKSFAAMRAWLDAGIEVPQISINISGDRLSNPQIVDQIKWAAETYQLDPGCIGLEILESVLVEEEKRALVQNVNALSAAGFRLELDDFGTGHASISALRTLSIDRIKIDRSLVSGIHRDKELRTITGAIIAMARALNIEVLAEGVECEAEQSILIAMGCGFVQGFGIARPMALPMVEEWMHSYQAKTLRPLRLA